MSIDNMLYNNPWFAWHPVKTECGDWVWLTWVREEIDETPLLFGAWHPTIKYYKI